MEGPSDSALVNRSHLSCPSWANAIKKKKKKKKKTKNTHFGQTPSVCSFDTRQELHRIVASAKVSEHLCARLAVKNGNILIPLPAIDGDPLSRCFIGSWDRVAGFLATPLITGTKGFPWSALYAGSWMAKEGLDPLLAAIFNISLGHYSLHSVGAGSFATSDFSLFAVDIF